ncbi:Mce family protein [Rhodococcus sp. ACPA4]|jgi:phospholipid/cholesterol/gamma-HCH transport system substrate-binding protein|uniref:Phospholipid/cholesterol/gamma-HCH transport system substrate-binding protein n=2 Tax=Nocardiaceae TaxID=85025 RepID=A0A652YUB4_NOCGL|nr:MULTISPECIES: MCE family protein [Rhodococcus]NMD60797.1 MCE family protein [Nocardia globerula]KJF20919.1 virulence factor Mce family protein [Rhodococcus sp. AD45]MDV6270045.1 MCE family protein [Rhodococcus globerulus]MDV8066973.1 MCE family protein [Rhodococcus sp. IEGM 1366]NRI65344.1 MCE family protein [Rhodococcus sp. MS16]
MTVPRWHKKLAAAGLILGLAAIVAVALTMFAGGFTESTPITVMSARAGLVMEPDAKVKLRGVQVGSVESISLDGDQASLQLAMYPDQMSKIPSNAGVEIKSTTVFGAKYVNIVIPDDPSTQPIQEGAVITSDSVTVEFNSVFEHLSEVLAQVEPEKLNATLGAISTALNGRGEALGEVLELGDTYLQKMNPTLPQLQEDLASAATVTNLYADVAPDLLRILDNATTTSGSIVAEQANLDLLLLNITGLANTGNALLTDNEQDLTTSLDTLTATTTLLEEYSPGLTCFLVGLNDGRIKFEPMAGTGDKAALMLSASFMWGAKAYTNPESLPKVAASGGPNCYGFPTFDPKVDGKAPFAVTNTGNVPFVPNTEFEVTVPTIFQFLFGDSYEQDGE